jgi:hypothetical protein
MRKAMNGLRREIGALFAALLPLVFLLCACGQSTTPSADSTAPATTPTATPRPIPPTPTNVPDGWKVYTGVYFAIAYPADWSVTPNHQGTEQEHPGTVAISYGFRAPDGHYFALAEEDHLDAATLQQNCTAAGQMTKVIAGLPMRYHVSNQVVHEYDFGTTQGVAYGFIATILQDDTKSQPLYESIFNTFRPVYTASACQ